MRSLLPDQFARLLPLLLRVVAAGATLGLGYYVATNFPMNSNLVFPALLLVFFIGSQAFRPPHSR